MTGMTEMTGMTGMTRMTRMIWLQGLYPVLIKTIQGLFLRTFQGQISNSSGTPIIALSICLFKFFHNMTANLIFILMVSLCLLLLGTWESGLDKVSSEIQGLSRCMWTLRLTRVTGMTGVTGMAGMTGKTRITGMTRRAELTGITGVTGMTGVTWMIRMT